MAERAPTAEEIQLSKVTGLPWWSPELHSGVIDLTKKQPTMNSTTGGFASDPGAPMSYTAPGGGVYSAPPAPAGYNPNVITQSGDMTWTGGGANPYTSGPVSGGAGSGQYSALLQSVLGQINGMDQSGQINAAFDAQTQQGIQDLQRNNTSLYASRGFAPSDPAAQDLNSRLLAHFLGPLAADRASALANAGNSKISALSSLLPGIQSAQNAQQQFGLDQQRFQMQQQAQAAQLAQDQQRWQWEQQDRAAQMAAQQKAATAQVHYTQPVSAPTPVYAAAQQAQQAYRTAAGSAAPQPSASAVPSGYTGPVASASGMAGLTQGIGASFANGFGSSFYAPTGLGGVQNAIDSQNRQAQISQAGNGGYSSFSAAVQGQPRPTVPSMSTYNQNGATNAPVAGGAILQSPFSAGSGISVAGPMSSSPLANGSTPYGSWLNGGASAYGDAVGAWRPGVSGANPYAVATGRA